ncbi:MAG: DUF1045 domain-containing protein [Acetobacteraceae bacterium]|nr:DUF1045 domain-containing protein [Acetobacteraceae bacterium]
MSVQRVAVYFAPAIGDALSHAGATWLGRDAQHKTLCEQPPWPGVAEITAEARLYGFHATLKPPMRLADGHGWADLLQATDALATRHAPFDLPALEVMSVHGFLALREQAPCPSLQTLADDCVAQLDGFRAPPSEADLARRRQAILSPNQKELLTRWGYPYVFQEWFFHMTLTRQLTATEHANWQPAAEAHFSAALRQSRRVTDICLFTQLAPGEAFTIAARLALRG